MARRLYEYVTPLLGKLTLTEGAEGRELYMSGLFIQGNVKNQNGRIYPASEIKNAVNTIKNKLADEETIFGELDHPEELQINLDRVSHLITEMWVDGSNGMGKLKVIDTPMGNIARSLLKAGAKLGVSSRGSGNVGDDGNVSDFDIITVDLVATPSAPDAYPKAIYESLFNMRGGSVVYETAVSAVHDKSAEIYLTKAIHSLIRELKLK